jgi:hypothetical protein
MSEQINLKLNLLSALESPEKFYLITAISLVQVANLMQLRCHSNLNSLSKASLMVAAFCNYEPEEDKKKLRLPATFLLAHSTLML